MAIADEIMDSDEDVAANQLVPSAAKRPQLPELESDMTTKNQVT